MTTSEVLSSDFSGLDTKQIHGLGEEAIVDPSTVRAEVVELHIEKGRLLLAKEAWDTAKKDHKLYASAIEEWLSEAVTEIEQSDVEIDDVRIAEAEILDRIIEEFAEDEEEGALIELATALRNKKIHQVTIEQMQAELGLAA